MHIYNFSSFKFQCPHCGVDIYTEYDPYKTPELRPTECEECHGSFDWEKEDVSEKDVELLVSKREVFNSPVRRILELKGTDRYIDNAKRYAEDINYFYELLDETTVGTFQEIIKSKSLNWSEEEVIIWLLLDDSAVTTALACLLKFQTHEEIEKKATLYANKLGLSQGDAKKWQSIYGFVTEKVVGYDFHKANEEQLLPLQLDTVRRGVFSDAKGYFRQVYRIFTGEQTIGRLHK